MLRGNIIHGYTTQYTVHQKRTSNNWLDMLNRGIIDNNVHCTQKVYRLFSRLIACHSAIGTARSGAIFRHTTKQNVVDCLAASTFATFDR